MGSRLADRCLRPYWSDVGGGMETAKEKEDSCTLLHGLDTGAGREWPAKWLSKHRRCGTCRVTLASAHSAVQGGLSVRASPRVFRWARWHVWSTTCASVTRTDRRHFFIVRPAANVARGPPEAPSKGMRSRFPQGSRPPERRICPPCWLSAQEKLETVCCVGSRGPPSFHSAANHRPQSWSARF